MCQLPSAFKSRYLLGPCSVLVVAYLTLHLFRQANRGGLAIVGQPTVSAGRLALKLTNNTESPLLYRASRPIFKRFGVWETDPSMEYFIVQFGTFIRAPPEVLPARGTTNIIVDAPFHITTPLGARSWRAAVVWDYPAPSRFQVAENKVMNFIRSIVGLSPKSITTFRTEYSPEFAL